MHIYFLLYFNIILYIVTEKQQSLVVCQILLGVLWDLSWNYTWLVSSSAEGFFFCVCVFFFSVIKYNVYMYVWVYAFLCLRVTLKMTSMRQYDLKKSKEDEWQQPETAQYK